MNATQLHLPDRDLLDFAASWARYGGGPADEIHKRFGLSDTDFFTRILELTDPTTALEERTSRRLRHVARQRLWLRRIDSAHHGRRSEVCG